jgi:hypothetical protein
MTSQYISTADKLAVQAIWYGFFSSNIEILRQCGPYDAAGNPQETMVIINTIFGKQNLSHVLQQPH